MARKVRSNDIDNRTSRLKLTPRKKPYSFTSIGPGIALGYRRTIKGGGRWVVRCADGKGGRLAEGARPDAPTTMRMPTASMSSTFIKPPTRRGRWRAARTAPRHRAADHHRRSR